MYEAIKFKELKNRRFTFTSKIRLIESTRNCRIPIPKPIGNVYKGRKVKVTIQILDEEVKND